MRLSALPHLPASTSPADISAAIDEFGAVIVDGLVPSSDLARLRDDLGPWRASTAPGSTSGDPEWELFHGRNTVRVNGLIAKSPAVADLSLDPAILGVADERLIPDGGSIQISDTQLLSIGPGQPAQSLHRDQTGWPWFNQLLPGGPEIIVIAMAAISDCTEANGATRVVPFSHRQADEDRLFAPDASIPAEMEAGSVLLFSGKTIHGGGANRTTDEWRSVIHLSYLLGWLRAEEAHVKNISSPGLLWLDKP